MKYETDGNLQSAFSGESQANRRYLFFAARAEEEGLPQIARLFRAVAEAEAVHAKPLQHHGGSWLYQGQSAGRLYRRASRVYPFIPAFYRTG